MQRYSISLLIREMLKDEKIQFYANSIDNNRKVAHVKCIDVTGERNPHGLLTKVLPHLDNVMNTLMLFISGYILQRTCHADP